MCGVLERGLSLEGGRDSVSAVFLCFVHPGKANGTIIRPWMEVPGLLIHAVHMFFTVV